MCWNRPGCGRMCRGWLFIPLLLLLLLVVGGQAYGGSAQEFSFTSLDGNIYTSESLKGTPLVVNIGSHW